MKIILNGDEKIINEGMNILLLLEDYKLSPVMVAVELNNKIIKKDNYKIIEIKNGDKIEIVRMMGGG